MEIPDADAPRARIRRLPTAELPPAHVAAIRALMEVAFGSDEEERFTGDDWGHAIGGLHFVVELDGELIAHASVVERTLEIDGHRFRTGYVEAVATAPNWQGMGFGSQLMSDVTAYVREGFELGALGTGRHTFYERLGWQRWLGPSFVRTAGGASPTPDDDAYLMVLSTRAGPSFELTAPISCDWRPGDVW